MLTIHDEQLIRQLEQLAQQENRSVEDVLKSLVAQHEASQASSAKPEPSEAVRRARRSIYKLAREYWQEEGDAQKAALTDDDLDDQFAYFDEEGIPRLKSEVTETEPQPGSLAYAATIFRKSDFYSGQPDLADRAEEILADHFADDTLKRMRDQYATE